MLHTLELIILHFLLNLKAECILYSSPCLETQHWKKYEVRCPENQTIYIRQHNIRDSCQDEGLGCDEKTVNSCSSSLPLSRTITDYQTPFTESVNKCNGKRECILFTEYFERIESKDGALCRNNLNTSIFQRIEYECIPDVHVVDNCVREVDNQTEVHDIYLRFSVKNRNHSCRLIGGLSGIEILHTYNSALRLLFQHIPVYEHLEPSIGVYGVKIAIQTISLVLEIQGFDYSSYVLVKLLVRKISSGALQVGPFHEKTETAKGSENLRVNVFHWILTVFAAMLILLVLFLIFQRRKQSTRPIVINIDETDERLVFRFHPEKQHNASKVEMHKAERLCDQSGTNRKQTKDHPNPRVCVCNQTTFHTSQVSLHLSKEECSYDQEKVSTTQTSIMSTDECSYDKTMDSTRQASQRLNTPLQNTNQLISHQMYAEECSNDRLYASSRQTFDTSINDCSYDKARNSTRQLSQHLYTPLQNTGTVTENNAEKCQNEELDIYIEMLPRN